MLEKMNNTIKNIISKLNNRNFKSLFDDLRNSSKNYVKTNVLFTTFLATSLINAYLIRHFTVRNYFDINPIIADLAIILIIGSFGYFVKPKHQFKYFMTWSVIFTAICIINSLYYTNFKSFVSVSLLATSTQLVDVGDAIVQNILQFRDLTYLWQIAAMVFVNRRLKNKNYYNYASKVERGKIRAINTFVAGVILLAIFISTLNAVDISRLSKQWNREFVVLRFGIYTYQINDAFDSAKSRFAPMFGFDSANRVFTDFFEAREGDRIRNDYTNIFKGKNVIVIHAESFQDFALDVELNGELVAPFTNRLKDEGIYFSNFYAQDGVGTSSDTEFTFNTSLMPTTSGTVFVNYFDREYISIPKLLSDQGYYTFSMHGNNGSFWNRSVMHPNLGYDRFYSYPNDYVLDEDVGLGLSDESFFNQSLEHIKKIAEENDNWYGKLITLTNHTPFSDIYKVNDFDVTYRYEIEDEETGELVEVVAPYLEDTRMGNYLRSVNYADYTMELFFNALEEEGLLDNTVFIIYGDHDAKHRRSEFNRFYNYDPYTDSLLTSEDEDFVEVDFYKYELNRSTPLIIWSSDQEFNITVDKAMGMYDVMPTLGNMFGFHNPYAVGNDIFSVEENIVVFPNGNWLTNKVYYNSQQEQVYMISQNETVSVEYIEFYQEYAEDVIEVSNYITVHDLIRRTRESQELIEEFGG